MHFFQNSVLNKHLKSQDAQAIKTAYTKFTARFHDTVVQENIRNSKEEQYQGEFLIDLFVNVLGYTKNPAPNFNLTTEYKNVKDSKKADGAILLNKQLAREHAPSPIDHAPSPIDHAPSPIDHSAKVIAVIELKGTETTDLNRIEAQAFGYKNNQPECTYVITSNFEKLRFYIDNAIEHIEFNLFTLTEKEFELLWLCLAYVNIEKNLAKRIKDESVSQEDVITKSLYNDYSLFKRELHQNLVALNPDYDPLTLFKKSQKLLDRFLFLFFAEDRQLLPPNSVRLILDDWRDLQDRDVQIPLYDRFKKYFEYLNTGFKGKRYDVFAYNGGLFKTDVLLDALKIEDELLYRHAMKLSTYDFVSEVDVNILGHIFENSLNELDEIKAQLEGQQVDKAKSKRKKDGVFYTPKYITKYIVDNTVGKLCTEKKAELQLIEEEYTTDRKRTKKTIQPLFDKLTAYRNWLLQLTICDPACGSGAFLNQALDFLINEHKYIDELQAKLFGDAMVLSDFEKNILENNLFGVDLNEESVEIAKLSLWLRTAQPNRKLNDLNNNIKCGNSLIDDPAVAGDKAFSWHDEFPTVFPEKAKRAWHVTTATHNSRYSQRMIDYHVQVGEPVWLSEKEEIIVTETIAKIVIEDKLNVMAYNICGDHMHIVLACEEVELPSIMQKIKSMSARACNIAMGRTIPQAVEHAPRLEDERGKTQFHLWTQKFGSKEIVTEEQLNNTIAYVQNNRIKHQLASQNIDNSGEDNSCGACSTAVDNTDADNNGEYSITHVADPANSAIPANSINGDGACSIAINTAINTAIDTIAATFTSSVSYALRTEYKGGFDVVIGNPPYGAKIDKTQIDFISTRFDKSLSGEVDTYIAFYFEALYLLKLDGYLGYITPDTWLTISRAQGLRKFIYHNSQLINVYDRYKPFQDAKDTRCHTIILKKNKTTAYSVEIIVVDSSEKILKSYSLKSDVLKESNCWNLYTSPIENVIFNKMLINSLNIEEIYNLKYGLRTGDNSKYLTNQISNIKIARGSNIQRYYFNWIPEYLITTEGLPESYFGNAILSSPKIIIQYVRTNSTDVKSRWLEATFIDDYNFVPLNSTSFFYAKTENFSLKYLLTIISSYLLNFYYKAHYTDVNVKPMYLSKLPIPKISLDQQQPFIEKADLILSLNKVIHETSQRFQRTIQRKFNIEELPGKLQNWYLLTYNDFIKELAKKKVKLSLSEENEWEAFFLQEAKQALALKSEIDKTDKEIDRMVYELYGLTEEEIKIVEGQ